MSNKCTRHNIKIGKIGELAASLYLRNAGFSILSCNLRLKRGEIDILAQKDKDHYVFEVKTLYQMDILSNREDMSETNPISPLVPENNLNKLKIKKLRQLGRMVRMFMGVESVRICGLAVRIMAGQDVTPETSRTCNRQSVSPRVKNLLKGTRIFIKRYDDIICSF